MADLLRQHYGVLLRLAYCLVGNRETAEEAVTEAFCSLHRHWGSVSSDGAASAYLRPPCARCHRAPA